MSPFRVAVSARAADRLAVAHDLLGTLEPGRRVVVVGDTRGAADDLVRGFADRRPATVGLQRFSLTQLAARTAMRALARAGRTPSTRLGTEAVAARAAFDGTRGDRLGYFAPVAATPGFPRALARTLQELRLASIGAEHLRGLPRGGPELADLLARADLCFAQASTADRAELFRTAAEEWRRAPAADVVVLLDLALDHAAERAFLAAVTECAALVLATLPASDREGLRHLSALGGVADELPDRGTGDLAALRRHLFRTEAPDTDRPRDTSIEFFSAPGEGREAVEIARRLLREARAGVRFDEMAILVRSPPHYVGLIEQAMRRARVPAWFSRGARRPHPAGRAFLALLACRDEGLSASRFAEYLSFAQVPPPDAAAGVPWAASGDELFGRAADADPSGDGAPEVLSPATAAADEERVVAGTLRAPWRWEGLLADAGVIGRSAERWRRRLDGADRELTRRIREAAHADGGDDARVEALAGVQRQLHHLQGFALPVVDEMAAWTSPAPWGVWLDRFERLAPRVLRAPSHVLRVLADLRPMSEVGPVDLDEVRRVLSPRLSAVEDEPPASRFGRVFVGTPEQARGRSFRVVFVPGLAERMFPQKPREDPLLLDPAREALAAPLPTQRQRLAAERLLLQIAAGAATDRLYVSYPRIELGESRARVPSFYALDVVRAVSGQLPNHEWLEAQARAAGDATLAWPAPTRPDEAIDDQERDLAVIRGLLAQHPDAVRGHAHYLLKLNECLRRSVTDRWARGQPRWSAHDGLTRVRPYTQAALDAQRLRARAYSASALQRFAACPYQFVLSAIYRLRPLEAPEPLQRMDPLTRGSLFHEMQAVFLRTLQRRGLLPVTHASLDAARVALDDVVDDVAGQAYDNLVPAVDRVWQGELASMRRDLHGWLDHVAGDGAEWMPSHFEFAFGTVPGERDAHSVDADVVLAAGFRLRGAVDLIEAHRERGVLRVTDHKTGRAPDRLDRVVIGGGAMLQPVLYAMAVEQALERSVDHARLFYCTSAGGFRSHTVVLDDASRAAGREVLEIVDRAVERGFLAAAPTADACARCDFRAVCGGDVYRRVSRKPRQPLADLEALRSRA